MISASYGVWLGIRSSWHDETHAALSRFWLGKRREYSGSRIQVRDSRVSPAKIAPAHKGLRPQSPLALSLGLPISTYWLHLASRYRRFWLATHARFIVSGTPDWRARRDSNP